MLSYYFLVFSFLVILLLKSMGSYLMMLVLLEMLVFISFYMYMDFSFIGLLSSSFSMGLLYLVIMIFEGVFGLSLLMSFAREGGESFFLSH